MYSGPIRSAIHAATRSALAITALLPGINLRNITFEEENKRDRYTEVDGERKEDAGL